MINNKNKNNTNRNNLINRACLDIEKKKKMRPCLCCRKPNKVWE